VLFTRARSPLYPPATPLDLAGRTLVSKYRIERMLGQGGMGTVWSGTHSLTGRKIAVKVLDKKFLANAGVVQRFQREARAASSIAHEGIVEVLDLGQTEEGVPILVMEFLEGESLAHRIDHGARMTEDQVLSIGAQLLDALHAAHESGVIHRDLKPDNIFLVPGATEERVKILDFGISWKDDEQEAKLTVVGSVLGTPHYMSPEQAMGESDIDRRADIYAAGVVLYECAVGAVPFEGANYNKLLRVILDSAPVPPSERGARISPAVEAVILGALSKRRDDRPSTAAEMRARLLQAARDRGRGPSGLGLSPPKSGIVEIPRRPGSGNQWVDAELQRDPASLPKSKSQPALSASAPTLVPSPSAPTPVPSPSAASPSAPSPPGSTPEPAPAEDGLALDPRAHSWLAQAGRQAEAAAVQASETRRSVTNPGLGVSTNVTGRRPVLPGSEVSEPPPRRWGLVAAIVAVVAVGGVALGLRSWVSRPPPSPPPTSVAPPVRNGTSPPPAKQAPQFVELTIDFRPADAEVSMRLDGIPGATSPIRVRRGTLHVLEISARGFADARVELQSERDRTIEVALVPER
jgi:serine/threonine protein kinase